MPCGSGHGKSNILVWNGVCVPDSTLHTFTQKTGVPPTPRPPTPYFHHSKSSYCYKSCRLRVCLVFPRKSALGTRSSFSLRIVERERAWNHRRAKDAAGWEKHESLGPVCSPSFFSLPSASLLSRFGWFSRAYAFRSLYSPWEKMRDYS